MIEVDFGRPPTHKEKLKFQERVSRLDRQDQAIRIERMYKSMPGELPLTGLAVRTGFSYRDQSTGVEGSDRSAPPREVRPPATRLMSPRGAALRLALTLLAVVQSTRKPGAKARIAELGIEVGGDSRRPGWSDFISADATDSNRGGVFLTARDKRARSVRSALLALADAGLVSIPGAPGERNRFEDFIVLNEEGVAAVGEHEEYRVPTRSDATFTMPHGFVANGWIHVLADTEIAVLLMVACRKGGWPENGLLVMPPDVRLQQYGIHRDGFSSARKTLEWFGLLRVEEIGRYGDGRAERGELRIHRLGLALEGFEQPAATEVVRALTEQIGRA